MDKIPLTRTEDNDSEWEYEYDEEQTQDYYVTLDFADVPVEHKRQHSGHFRLGPGFDFHPPQPPIAQHQEPGSSATNGRDEAQNSDFNPPPQSSLQILDLHGSNPIISYEGRIYSCSWASTVGTDLFFAEHDEAADRKRLKSLGAYDLLGLGRGRLVLKNAQITEKTRLHANARMKHRDVNIDSSDPNLAFTGPEGARLRQMKFMERLKKVKEKKQQQQIPTQTPAATATSEQLPLGDAENREQGGSERG